MLNPGGNMKLVGILVCVALVCNLVCLTTGWNIHDELETHLTDIKLNSSTLSTVQLLDYIKLKIAATHEKPWPHAYTDAERALDNLIGMDKLREYGQCFEKTLSLMGQFSNILLEAQNSGAPERKIDVIVSKLLKEQVHGPCNYEKIQAMFLEKLKKVRYNPTILDKLHYSVANKFFKSYMPDFKVNPNQWPNIIYTLVGQHQSRAELSDPPYEKYRILANEIGNQKFRQLSLNKFSLYHKTQLKPMCMHYARHGLGLFVRVAPFIKLFMNEEHYDNKLDRPKFFTELPETPATTIDRDLLYGWITGDTFNDLKRSYAICAELVNMTPDNLEKIYNSILAWRVQTKNECEDP